MKEPLPHHGLTQAAARQGWRLLEHAQRGDTYLSERTVFRDTSTGCLAWRMTCDPAVDVDEQAPRRGRFHGPEAGAEAAFELGLDPGDGVHANLPTCRSCRRRT